MGSERRVTGALRALVLDALTAPPTGRRLQERLQQLIRIDINGCDDVFRQRKFIQGLAHDPSQAHDRFTPKQDVEPELALQFFDRRRHRRAPDKLGRQRFP